MGSNSIDSGNSIFCNHVSQNVKESVYEDENDLSKSLSSYPLSHLQPLLVMHCNTISLTNRFDRLREFLKKFPVMPHLIAITETRLKTSSNLQSINLPQYTFCHADSLTLAGGVGVYIKDNLQFKVRSDLKFCNEGCENFWIELVPTNASTNFNNKQKTIIFGVIYKHPSTNIDNFTDSFEQTLQKLQFQGCKFFIFGDINVDYQRWSRGHKARGQGQGHKKNPRPRPRTAFTRTDTLEAKDRNARGQGQGPRTQPQVFSTKKRSSKIFFRHSPIYRRSQNF